MSRTPARGGYRSFLTIAAALAIGGGYLGWRARAQHEPATEARPAAPVTAATIEKGAFPVRIESIGTVQALNNVAVRARVDGQIEQVYFKEGQTVKAGDLLVRLDARPFQAALDQVVAKRAQDQATLDNAKRDLGRYSQLAAKNFATEQQLDTQRATVASGAAQVSADDAAIESARTQLGYTEIHAPIAGRVGFRQVDAGNIVHAGDSQPMLTIVQVDPIFVLFTLPEDRINEVQLALTSRPLEVDAYTSDRGAMLAQGALSVLNNQVDQASGSLQAKATFDNPKLRLWPGQSVVVSLHVRDLDNVVLTPDAAVQRGPDGLYVWLIEPDGTATIRHITTGPQGDGRHVVTSGLAAGDRVVVGGVARLYDHAKVAVSDAPREAPALSATRTQ